MAENEGVTLELAVPEATTEAERVAKREKESEEDTLPSSA